ncbi:MAG TPA: hypothetical protein VNI57_08055 [Candidatus Saccharimonadales bacterium]|nr:hypothetical protein [Candidatus Saccharimonadales bacterium]
MPTATLDPRETALVPAEQTFREGLGALEAKRYREAAALFQRAMDQENPDGPVKPARLRYGSYFGLALTLAAGRSEEGQKLCEQAVRREFLDADLFCNLGIVSLRNRNKRRAFGAFRQGLALSPQHPRILEQLAQYEKRAELVFPSLPRDHFLNKTFGLLRHRVLRFLGSVLPGRQV